MRGSANASVDAIEKFKSENADLDYCFNTLKSAAWTAITQLKSAAEAKQKTYLAMKAEAEGMVEKAGAKRSSTDQKAAARAQNARSQAENLRGYLQSQLNKMQEMIKTLDNFESTVYSTIDKALTMVQNADGALKAAIEAINEYTSYSLK